MKVEVNAARGRSLLRLMGSRLLERARRACVLCTVCSLRVAHPQMAHPVSAGIDGLLGVLRKLRSGWWEAVGRWESADHLLLPLPPFPRVQPLESSTMLSDNDGVCNSMPGWNPLNIWNPQDYHVDPDCRLNPMYQQRGMGVGASYGGKY